MIRAGRVTVIPDIMQIRVRAPASAFVLYDDFSGASPAGWWVAPLGVLATSGGALQASAIAADGNEILSNNDFLNWTGDNPDGWTVVGEVGADPMITQAGPSLGRWYTSTGAIIYAACIVPRVIAGATYSYRVVVSALVAGEGRLEQSGTDSFVSWAAPGTYAGTKTLSVGSGPSFGVNVARNRPGIANDFTLDSVSVIHQSGIGYGVMPGPNAILTASMISPAAIRTPRAILLRYQDTANFVRLLLLPNTAGTDTILETVTAGVRATVAQADVDWTAGGTDQVRVTVSGNSYTAEHKKSGAGSWTTAFTVSSSAFNTQTNFGTQLFTATDPSLAEILIQPI